MSTIVKERFCRILLGRQRILFCILLLIGFQLEAQENIRKPVVAGQFYPADRALLTKELEKRLQEAPKVAVDGDIFGLVAPHAGYQYSAGIAAGAYKQVANEKYDVVVILAPSHRDPFKGATIYPGTAYETPLGLLYIDRLSAEELVATCKSVHFSHYGHRAEHAIEVQLPFIQLLFPDTKIIPIVIGYSDWQTCEEIGQALAHVTRNKKVLFIASTDLYHGESYNECKRLSSQTLAAMTKLQPRELYQGLEAETLQACGGIPVVMVQLAARAHGAHAAILLNQTNSNDVTGQKGGYVVGYGAVAFYRSRSMTKPSSKIEFNPLDRKDQIDLLKMARHSIDHYLKYQTMPDFKPKSDMQLEKRGVFVTITENGLLRGCIGHHESDKPLYRLVPQMAIAAAFEDPRFPPLQAHELEKIKIKISVYLTNVYKIDTLDEFQMGLHGIILRKGRYAATYLPEVPIEAGWTTVDEELASLCLKAGLPADAWRDGAEFWIYRTQIFDESVLSH